MYQFISVSIATIFISVMMIVQCNGQELFTRVFGGASYDVGKAIVQLPDDDYIIAGNTGSFNFDDGQIMLMRINSLGNHVWNRFYGGDFADVCESMAITLDGGFVIAGYTETLDSTYNMLVIRTDSEGEVIWTRSFGTEQWDIAKKVLALDDGGFVVAGRSHGTENGQSNAMLVRLDAQGETLWSRTYGGSKNDAAESIDQTENGFVLAGYTESFGNGGKDVWVLRVDAEGDTIWTATYGEEEDDVAHAVIYTQGGDIAFAGSTGSGGYGGQDFYVVKVTGSGVHDWTVISSSSGPDDDEWYDIFEEQNGSLTMVGYGSNPNFGGGGLDAFMNRRTWFGEFDGVSGTYGEGANEIAHGVTATSDGGYAIVGETTGYLERLSDIIVFKTDQNGGGLGFTLDIQEISADGHSFKVTMAPNPTEGITTLHLEGFDRWAPQFGGMVSLDVMDAVGRTVHLQRISGAQTSLDLTTLPQGMYVYRVIAGTTQVVAGRVVKTN